MTIPTSTVIFDPEHQPYLEEHQSALHSDYAIDGTLTEGMPMDALMNTEQIPEYIDGPQNPITVTEHDNDVMIDTQELRETPIQLRSNENETILLSFAAGGVLAMIGVAAYRAYTKAKKPKRTLNCNSTSLSSKYKFLDTQGITTLSRERMI